METPPNNDNAAVPAAEFPNSAEAAFAQAFPDPDPKAPADPEDVAEQETRLEELSTLLGKVDAHVSNDYAKVLDASDDDTDAPQTSDAAESSCQVDEAYRLQAQAAQILQKAELTNEDLETLEAVIDDLDAKIGEATPMSFDPNTVPDDPLQY
jgi:hypothetical protein